MAMKSVTLTVPISVPLMLVAVIGVAVLLLNASFEPLRVIPVRRAIGLIVAGKVDVVVEGDGQIRSTSNSFPMSAARVDSLPKYFRW